MKEDGSDRGWVPVCSFSPKPDTDNSSFLIMPSILSHFLILVWYIGDMSFSSGTSATPNITVPSTKHSAVKLDEPSLAQRAQISPMSSEQEMTSMVSPCIGYESPEICCGR